MKKGVIAGVAAAAFCGTPALAADLAVKAAPPVVTPAYSWAGFYVGANAGGHWARDDDPAFVSFNNNLIPGNVALVNQFAPVNLNPRGFAGGAQAGYNLQMTNLVLGVEADIDGLTGTASRNLNTPIIVDTLQLVNSAQDRWMSTVRLRFGWAADRVLLYVTGGVAFSDWQLNHTYAVNGGGPGEPFGMTNTSTIRTGGTVGGGVEYALDTNWRVRAEYLYANFGTITSVVNGAVGPFNTAVTNPEKLSENIARLGITYNFGSH